MGWSGGTYRKGNYGTNGWTGDASLGIGIEAGRHDTQDDDFANGINACLNKDGSNSATGNLNIGANRVTNIGAATARTDAAQTAQVQDGSFVWGGTSGGSANAQTITASPAITAYAAGQKFKFIAGFTNTSAATLNVNGVGAKNIYYAETKAALLGNEIMAGAVYEVIYDGTQFLLMNACARGSFTNDALANNKINIFKSRGTSVGTNTIVQNGDQLGGIWFWGANGTGYDPAAAIIASSDGVPGASADMPGALRFYTTADGSNTLTEQMRISSNGQVSIGSTTTGSMLFIQNNQSNSIPCISIQSNVAGDLGTSAFNIVKKDNNSTTSQVMVRFLMDGAAAGQGQINANGAFQVAFGSYSDERLKENIVDLPSQLANIFSLRPVEFDYKDGFGHQIGFIAQEVREIYPDLVGDGQDGFLTLSGLGKNEARMVKAFQEFAQITQAKIDSLEARIAALEA